MPHHESSLLITITIFVEDLKTLQKLALANLGRNVLHFQRLEAQLKLLVLFGDIQAPLDGFAASHKKKAEDIRTKTMGAVVSELHERIYGKVPDLETTTAITEASLTFGFCVEIDPQNLAAEKQRLTDLVRERNQLIHHDLSGFDPNSVESCRHWITGLDEQNERIVKEFEYVQRLVNSCKEAFQKLLKAMDSEEWQQEFKRPPTRS